MNLRRGVWSKQRLEIQKQSLELRMNVAFSECLVTSPVGETWTLFDLDLLETMIELRPLKHEMSAHWVQLAAQLATKPIPLQPVQLPFSRRMTQACEWNGSSRRYITF